MGRFVAGVMSALLLVAAGFFFWRGQDGSQAAIPEPLAEDRSFALADVPRAPSAPEKSKEERRFNRYDKDKNGAVSQAEYLASRQKAYARLDVNHDGVLSFSEYATKTVLKFTKADADRTGALTRNEFATTRVVRKARPKPDCPPVSLRKPEAGSGDEEEA